jgi:hypothetical protein
VSSWEGWGLVPVLGQALIGESGADAADDLGLELAHPKVLSEIAVPHQQLVENHSERIHVYARTPHIVVSEIRCDDRG